MIITKTNTIYQGDILQVLEEIPDGLVDLAFADPPYNDGIDYGVYKDKRSDFWQWTKMWIDEYKRISNDTLAILVREDRIYGLNSLFPYGNLIRIRSGNSHFYLVISKKLICNYYIWHQYNESYFTSDKVRYNNPGLTSLSLMNWIIDKFSSPKNLVLDGFMGCGTTAVACKNLKRNFIGIELNPEYIKIANQRLSEAKNGEKTKL